MKNKLKKDLKFLNTIRGKVITASVIGILGFLIGHPSDRSYMYTYGMWGWAIATAISYVGLYFFNAWLVGDEEDNDSANVEK